jgi:ubiquinone/menaquinone biosynthesis C-methylase UbiE
MNIDLDEYREQSLETWDEMAAGWEARAAWMSETTGVVNEWILDKVDPQPRETVLDIAAGPGDLGLRIAARVGDGGRVLSTDFAPEMVAVARRIGDGRGLTNVEYRVLDAERMDLDDESVDSAVCRWGYMLMADPGRALSETKRVLHSGAGFGEPELEEIPFEFRYKDFDDLWDSLVRLAGPLAHAIKALDEGERRATYEAIEQNVAPFRQEDGSYLAPALCIGGLAR